MLSSFPIVTFGIIALISLVVMGLLLQEFKKTSSKRSELLMTFGGEGQPTRSNATLLSWVYITTTVVWTLLLFALLLWILNQTP